MTIKQTFAKTALGYKDEMTSVFKETGPAPVFITTGLAALIGLTAELTKDAVKPLDNHVTTGQEQAIDTYAQALTQLAEQRDALATSQYAQPESLTSFSFATPDIENNRDVSEKMQEQYTSLLNDFAVAVHVDERLNETDAKTLLTAFEEQHGALEDVTLFKTSLDYNDLSEARNFIKQNNFNYDSEEERAQYINIFAKDTFPSKTFITTGIGMALLPYLLLALIAGARKPLENWRDGNPLKQPKIKH